MAKRCLKVGRKSKSEARNLPTWGCKSMMEGPTIMLGVFIILLYMYTMPNKHYSSKPTSPRYHLMAKHCLTVGRKSRSEAWNLPTCGCKSMMDGLTIMLGVFINLLYTYTMPNNHYSTTYMLLYTPTTGDINSTCVELILRNKFPISGMILSEVSNEVFHK